MDKSAGQRSPVRRRGPRSSRTQQRLLNAAAELIAERGWGRVTTRAVAEQAGLPHGTVSYHFAGKEALLTHAAVHIVEQAFPIEELEQMTRLTDLRELVSEWTHPIGPDAAVETAVLTEAMRESSRNAMLRTAIANKIREYRCVMADLFRAEQERGVVTTPADPDALAHLVAAAGDGLMLHRMLDPGVDAASPIAALLVLLGVERSDHTHDPR